MDWLWPRLLLSLALIPLAVGIYAWVLRRRFTVRYSSLLLIKEGLPHSSWLRRHLPFILFLFALISLVIALGRPVTPVDLLAGRTTIILTLDISRSMCMRDIPPTRLDAAKGAALSFVQDRVTGTQVGLVAFAGFAELAQPPTTNVPLLEGAIQNLTTSTETAIGSAILRSLDAIAEVDASVTPSEEIITLSSARQSPAEDYVPHVIVLLTDGASNTGPPPLLAAQQAAQRGVRIYTIAFGTTKNSVMDCGTSLADNTYLSPGLESYSSGGNSATEVDEATLRQIANMTGGKFYAVTSADELQMVFQDLQGFIASTNQSTEISVFFTAFAVLVAIVAMTLALLWHPLI